ncbi:phage protease [Aeromonas rivuli]|uniref:phage protease n=1 Tax=Aeromonas rivuli TaxID=648794 RepID=UPI0005A5DB8D|nr:phage protease [Aeromonas rivuli]
MPKTYLALCFDLSRQQVRDEKVWLPLIPPGVFSGNDGRSWNNSNPDAVVASFTKKRPFDVEHATHILGPQGKPAPAHGWIEALQNIDGEVWGMVEWNEDGERALAAKNYAFYSPSFTYDANGVVRSITSAALTNDPNLDQLPALNREETPMPLPVELTQALGLGADADIASALTAINTIKADHQLALNRAATGPDLTKFVPKETYELALNRATTAETKVKQTEEAKLATLVDGAIASGKIAPANKEMFLGMCRAEGGVEQFNAFVASAPVIADASVVKTTTEQAGALSTDELALCRKMGHKPEEFLAAKQAMKAKQGE